jgi:enamine deaminase RidA (YjgF/YER057c/UK114 family)
VHSPAMRTSPLYAHGIVSNGVIYVAGTVGIEDMGAVNKTLCAGGIQNETRCALANIKQVLAAAKATPDDLIDCTIFVGACHTRTLRAAFWFFLSAAMVGSC